MKNQIEIKKVISPFNKKIEVSGDKSISIRCVLLASQAIGKSKIYNLLESEDVINSLKAIKKLGISYKKIGKYYQIYGYGINSYQTKKKITINAGNSGTLARLILGLLVDIKKEVKIVGDKSLSVRDFSRITNPLKLFGANILSKKNNIPIKIIGSNFLRPIKYKENLGSAQCKSGDVGHQNTRYNKSDCKNKDHTELMFKYLKIPIKIIKKDYYDFIEINGPYNFQGFEYKVPADISSSSFFIVLALLSKKSKIILKNVNVNNSRTGIIKILNKMNAKIILKNKKIYNGERIADIVVKSQNNLKGIKCPKKLNSSAIDEFLIIFLAVQSQYPSFKDLSELNKKRVKDLK